MSHQGQVSGYFGQSFSLNLILLLIISYSNNLDLCTLRYHYITYLQPSLHHHSPYPHSFHFTQFSVSLCEGTHRNAHSTFLFFFPEGGHLWLCYLRYQPVWTL